MFAALLALALAQSPDCELPMFDHEGNVRATWRTACGLTEAEQVVLQAAAAQVRDGDFETADAFLDGRDPARPSVDLELLRAAVKAQLDVRRRLEALPALPRTCTTGITAAGERNGPSEPVETWADGKFENPGAPIVFPGRWARGGPDIGYELDQVDVLEQNPDGLKLHFGGRQFWVRHDAVYLRRLVVQRSETHLDLVACLPDLPFEVQDVRGHTLTLQFYADYWEDVLGPLAARHGMDDALLLRDHLNEPWNLLNPALVSPYLHGLRWGVPAEIDLNSGELTLLEGPPMVRYARQFGFERTTHEIETCGESPHGPTGMRLCQLDNLHAAGDGSWLVGVALPHTHLH